MLNQAWKYFRQSVTGPAHLRDNLPNQDYTMGRLFHKGMAIAVADGLGSKALSHLGSKAACESVMAATQFIIKHNIQNETVLPRMIHAFWCAMLVDYDLKECGTTINYAIILEDYCYIGKLGDGMILLEYDQENPQIFDRDQEDSFSNLTNSLSEHFRPEEWQTKKLSSQSLKMIFMCTDGISEDLMSEHRVTFAKELLVNCLKSSKKVRSRFTKKILQNWPVVGHSDDKSFIFAFRSEP